jgi:hypothetical protein
MAGRTIFEVRCIHHIVGKALYRFPAVPALVICMTGCAVYMEKLAVHGLFFRIIVV